MALTGYRCGWETAPACICVPTCGHSFTKRHRNVRHASCVCRLCNCHSVCRIMWYTNSKSIASSENELLSLRTELGVGGAVRQKGNIYWVCIPLFSFILFRGSMAAAVPVQNEADCSRTKNTARQHVPWRIKSAPRCIKHDPWRIKRLAGWC